MHETHDEGFTCTQHCGRKFEKKKYLQAHMARIKARDSLRLSKLYLFDDESGEFNSIVKQLKNEESVDLL